MKALVLIKPTPDTEAKIMLTSDRKAIDHASTKFIINPYDEFAIEEALKLKEAGKLTEVVLCTFTSQTNKEVVVKGLAMGADRAIIIDNQGCESLDSANVARLLAAAVKAESPQIILGGKQAIDDDNMHVLTMVAEVLGLPHVNVVTKLEVNGETAKVEREVEGGQTEVYEVKLPVVLGAHKSLNSPRYTSLPGIMKARKKQCDVKTPADLGFDGAVLLAKNKAKFQNFQPPAEKPPGKVFKGEPLEDMVDKVVKLLRNEAKVI